MPPTPSSSDGGQPTAQRHLDGADANLAHGDFLRECGRTDSATVGWGITALFYTAVHVVRAYLAARHGVVVDSHEQMRKLWSAHPEIGWVKTHYRHLKQESEAARYYLSQHFTWEDYDTLRKTAVKIRSGLDGKITKALGKE